MPILQNLKTNWFPAFLCLVILVVLIGQLADSPGDQRSAMLLSEKFRTEHDVDSTWYPPVSPSDDRVNYGRDLIAHTAKYFGPNGSIAQNSNGMNCQNCHLDAGARPWGNNYSAVYSTYPQFRPRSNSVQEISFRVNDCFERSLNGQALDTSGAEMKAISAYIKWLGSDVPKGKKPYSSGLPKLTLLDREADASKGRVVYMSSCKRCHGATGEGVPDSRQVEYIYPPVWGEKSYNDGAGLFRLSSFASFVRSNMPYNEVSHEHPLLTVEQCWDVAAFVNSQPRPHFDQQADWPDLSKKAFDAPYGPYADSFSVRQHKYGPFQKLSPPGRR